MLRIIFALFVAIHGLIHLLGLLKEWGLARVDQLSGKTLVPLSDRAAHLAGGLWLTAAVLFAVAAAALLARRDWWWMAAAAGIILSQALIILYWKDAFAGTVANALILPVTVVAAGMWSFGSLAAADVEAIMRAPSEVTWKLKTGDFTWLRLEITNVEYDGAAGG